MPNNALVAFQPPVVILQVSPDAFIYCAEPNLAKGYRDSFNTHHVQSILHVWAALSFISDEDLSPVTHGSPWLLSFPETFIRGIFSFQPLLHGMWDLSSPTRGQNYTPCGKGEVQSLSHWTTSEVPRENFFLLIELPFLFPPVSLSESDALMIPHSCSLLAVITANCNCLLTHVHPPLNSNPRRLARACLGCVCAPLSPDASR